MTESLNFRDTKWIGTGRKETPALIKKEFNFTKDTKAEITVACMGTFILTVNGKPVSDDLFLPLNTDFEKRYDIPYGDILFNEELAHRLYCPRFDMTKLLHEGRNTLTFYLAPGFYEEYGYGTAKLSWDIAITDKDGNTQHFYPDGTEKYTRFHVKEADVIRGEAHDYTDCTEVWENTVIHEAPDTCYFLQDCPSDRVIRKLTPRYLGNDIWDAGEVMTGYPVIKSNKAQKITVRYGELLNDDCTLDEMHIYGQHTDYITDDNERILHPEFTWLCFRYFEVIGDCEVLDCLVIHSDVDVSSEFECSDDTLNWVRKAYIRTQLANMHCGIPSDCPHTERRGYTGDGQLTCAAAMMQLDARKFYRKWISDICDCQDRRTGHIQYTAPFVPSGGGPGGWGCAIVVVPYEFYKAYGDKSVFDETFGKMLRWFDYMESHSENELVTSDLPGVWCLGDWCAPTQNQLNKLNGMLIPRPFVNTYFFIKSMEYFLEICDITGNTQYKKEISEKIAVKKEAITETYFNAETGNFADNEQGANAFAVDIGLGDERTFSNIIKHYTETKMFDTGIFGTDIVTRVLFERKRADVAFMLLTSKEETSYYNQIQNGATTLLEYWNGVRSQCHPMFGAVTRYLFEYILGIKQEKNAEGYKKVIIEPVCMEYLPCAKGKIQTVKGEIAVSYDSDKLEVSVPESTEAVLKLRNREYLLNCGKNLFKLQDIS